MATEDVSQLNTIPNETPRNLVVDLYRNKYYDANFVHFNWVIRKTWRYPHLPPSAVMSILEAEYILSPKATKAKKRESKNN